LRLVFYHGGYVWNYLVDREVTGDRPIASISSMSYFSFLSLSLPEDISTVG